MTLDSLKTDVSIGPVSVRLTRNQRRFIDMSGETISGFVLRAVEERCSRYVDYMNLRIQEVAIELAQLNDLKAKITSQAPLDDAVREVWVDFEERLKGPGGRHWGHDLAWVEGRAERRNLMPERLLGALWSKAGLSPPPCVRNSQVAPSNHEVQV